MQQLGQSLCFGSNPGTFVIPRYAAALLLIFHLIYDVRGTSSDSILIANQSVGATISSNDSKPPIFWPSIANWKSTAARKPSITPYIESNAPFSRLSSSKAAQVHKISEHPSRPSKGLHSQYLLDRLGEDELIKISPSKSTLASPNYPFNYPNQTSKEWFIERESNHRITISFDDLDIEQNEPFECENLSKTSGLPCCLSNWVKIGNLDGGSSDEVRYCGSSSDRKMILQPFVSKSNRIYIKFHTAETVVGGRGFHLTIYSSPIEQEQCDQGEFRCQSGKCIPLEWRCNQRIECSNETFPKNPLDIDRSDEEDCDEMCIEPNEKRCGLVEPESQRFALSSCYSFPKERCDGLWQCPEGDDELGCNGCPPEMFSCPIGNKCLIKAKKCDGVPDCPDYSDEMNCGPCEQGKVQCDANTLECFDPLRDRCNHVLDCSNGFDEKGCIPHCQNKITCPSKKGCFTEAERCDGIPQCDDGFDEMNCTARLCSSWSKTFLCESGRCILFSSTCDGKSDCGGHDESDEMNCIKNSVITAAIMGSLICGLLLVVAISCSCKLVALRQRDSRSRRRRAPSHTCTSSLSAPRMATYPPHTGNSAFNIGMYPDTQAPLFPMDDDIFYREPPPSYAVACRSSTERSNPCSVLDQIRQARRQRRTRRPRRRPPTPPPTLSENDSSIVQHSCNQISQHIHTTHQSASVLNNGEPANNSMTSHHHANQPSSASDDKSGDSDDQMKYSATPGTVSEPTPPSSNIENNSQSETQPQISTNIVTNPAPSASPSPISPPSSPNGPTEVNIELEDIPSLAHDLDSRPLLS